MRKGVIRSDIIRTKIKEMEESIRLVEEFSLVWQMIVALLELISAGTQSRNWRIRSSRIQTL